jgi:hypothetical protein
MPNWDDRTFPGGKGTRSSDDRVLIVRSLTRIIHERAPRSGDESKNTEKTAARRRSALGEQIRS